MLICCVVLSTFCCILLNTVVSFDSEQTATLNVNGADSTEISSSCSALNVGMSAPAVQLAAANKARAAAEAQHDGVQAAASREGAAFAAVVERVSASKAKALAELRGYTAAPTATFHVLQVEPCCTCPDRRCRWHTSQASTGVVKLLPPLP